MKKAMMMGATLLVLVGMTFALPLGQAMLTEENAEIVALQMQYRIAELVNVLEMTPEQIAQVHDLALATREKLDGIKDNGTHYLEDALAQMVDGNVEEAQRLHEEAENAVETGKTAVEAYVEEMKTIFTAAQVENYKLHAIAQLKERSPRYGEGTASRGKQSDAGAASEGTGTEDAAQRGANRRTGTRSHLPSG